MLNIVGTLSIAEEIRSREPNEQDSKDIAEMRAHGYSPAAISSGIELDVRKVRKVIKNLPKPTKETAAQRMDRAMAGRVR